MSKSIDELITDTYAAEEAAVALGKPGRMAAYAVRSERAAHRKSKRSLVALAKDLVQAAPGGGRAAMQALVDDLMPDTPDPVQPGKAKAKTKK